VFNHRAPGCAAAAIDHAHRVVIALSVDPVRELLATACLVQRVSRHLPAILGTLAALALLAGCTTAGGAETAGGDSSDVPGAGYVSGDGSVETWAPDERGQAVNLAGVSYEEENFDLADLHGQVVVVNFWYANCPPCRKEAPDLASLSEQYEPDGVQFLGVNHTDAPGTAQAFERRFGIPYPSLHDQESAGVAAMQGVVPLRAMPTTVVLDTQGRVAARILGLAERSILSTLIDETLAE